MSVPFTPPGLLPGDKFHIAFVTAGTRNAQSPNIADYNLFVSNQATASGAITETWGVKWYAIASTQAIDARDNAFVSAPVFLLRSPGPFSISKLANGFADMWDGPDIADGFTIDQFGNGVVGPGQSRFVYTGSNDDGTQYFDRFGVTNALGSGASTGIRVGNVINPWMSANNSIATFERPFYALSEELTVAAVPEPSSLLLAPLGLGLYALVRRRRMAKEVSVS
ncbi:MAG: PEP-CTERM sorting domain-containing protein [Planctomycetota bacterium]|nr:PEP-CTERM sorting domain-containing protein [Planctomycetota bacterium]